MTLITVSLFQSDKFKITDKNDLFKVSKKNNGSVISATVTLYFLLFLNVSFSNPNNIFKNPVIVFTSLLKVFLRNILVVLLQRFLWSIVVIFTSKLLSRSSCSIRGVIGTIQISVMEFFGKIVNDLKPVDYFPIRLFFGCLNGPNYASVYRYLLCH